MVALARQLHRSLRARQPQRLARIELAEVYGLGDIGIRLRPILAHFKHQPGFKLELALADDLRHPQ